MVSAASAQMVSEPTPNLETPFGSLERQTNSAAASRMLEMPRALVDTHDVVWTNFLAGVPLDSKQQEEIAETWMEPLSPVRKYTVESDSSIIRKNPEAEVMLTGLGGR
jgi:hypothetical protein